MYLLFSVLLVGANCCCCCCCSELISCSHHLSIQSAIMSSSPIKFRISDDDRSASYVTMDADSMATESPCCFHDDSDTEETDMSVSACDACDERERFALLDSPPVSVLTGIISTHCCYCPCHCKCRLNIM